VGGFVTLASGLFLGISIFIAFSVVIYSYFSTFHKAGVLLLKEGENQQAYEKDSRTT